MALLRRTFNSYEILSLKSLPLENLDHVKQIYNQFKHHNTFLKCLALPSDSYYSLSKKSSSSLSKIQGLQHIKTWVISCLSPYLHKNEKIHVCSILNQCSPSIYCFTSLKNTKTLYKQGLDLISQPNDALHSFWKLSLNKEPCVLMLFDNDQAIAVDFATANHQYLTLPFSLNSIALEKTSVASKTITYDEKKLVKIAEDARLLMSPISKTKPLVIVGSVCYNPSLVKKWASLLGFTLSPKQNFLVSSRTAMFPLSIGAALSSSWKPSKVERAITPVTYIYRFYSLVGSLCYKLKHIVSIALLSLILIVNAQLNLDKATFQELANTLEHKFPELALTSLNSTSLAGVQKLRAFYRKQAVASSFSNKFWADSILWLQTALSPLELKYQLEQLEMVPASSPSSNEEIVFRLTFTGEASIIRDLVKKLYIESAQSIKVKGKVTWNSKGSSHDISFTTIRV